MFRRILDAVVMSVEHKLGRAFLKASMVCKKASDAIANDLYKRVKKDIETYHPEFMEDEEFSSRWNEVAQYYES